MTEDVVGYFPDRDRGKKKKIGHNSGGDSGVFI